MSTPTLSTREITLLKLARNPAEFSEGDRRDPCSIELQHLLSLGLVAKIEINAQPSDERDWYTTTPAGELVAVHYLGANPYAKVP
jgi:hypothetical protein